LCESGYHTILSHDNGFYSANHIIKDTHAIIIYLLNDFKFTEEKYKNTAEKYLLNERHGKERWTLGKQGGRNGGGDRKKGDGSVMGRSQSRHKIVSIIVRELNAYYS